MSLFLRRAKVEDIPRLLEFENRFVVSDRMTKRHFQWMLKKGHCLLNLVEFQNQLAGYVLVLFHRGTSLSRLYSVAWNPAFEDRDIRSMLFDSAEVAAEENGCIAIRLETRTDDPHTVEFLGSRGYRQFEIREDYFEDHSSALCFQKRVRKVPVARRLEIPYYAQTLDFTCGPASLMMAMNALNPAIPMTRRLELVLWREATTIFMLTGHGGCSPRGLALSAWRRGFDVELYVSRTGALFLNGVRSEYKKEVLELVHEEFEAEIQESGIRSYHAEMTQDGLEEALEKGGVPLILISAYQFSNSKSPHWVVVTAMDDRYIYIHDPEIDEDEHKTILDTQYVPIPRQRFARMARYGQNHLRAAVVIYPRNP